MWPDTQIELKLKQEFSQTKNELVYWPHFIPAYEAVKSYMIKEVYPNIARIEPDLTDHGEIHIQDVLRNAYAILEDGVSESISEYTPLELCVLCMSILVHDIGNLHGRVGHEKVIPTIFTGERFPGIDNALRRTVIQVAKAHGGKGDTIEELGEKNALFTQQIRSSSIAALLRFADELSEGPHRTSRLMLQESMISDESIIFHEYANLTNPPCIASGNVVLGFDISVDKKDEKSLRELISFVFKRVYKLNRERIYCGLYSAHIQRIKSVNVSITFYEDDELINPIIIPNELTNFRLTNLECSEFKTQKKSCINKLITHLLD